MISEIILIGLLLLIFLYWSSTQHAREVALYATQLHCQKLQLQLLDGYVALTGFWFKRDEFGRIKAWRSYQFEFSSTGEERYNGKIILLGHNIQSIQLEPYRINTE